MSWLSRWMVAVVMVSFVLPLGVMAQSQDSVPAKIDAALLSQQEGVETTFWVLMEEKADLSPAFTIQDWQARGEFVVDALQEVARNSQGDVRKLLNNEGVAYESFWVSNAIQVTGDVELAKEISVRSEVEQIVVDEEISLPELVPGTDEPRLSSLEWNIERVRADEVWSDYGTRGEGIIVANIDSGVQFDHPALVNQYRGTQSSGGFDHNYNWFDPSEVCGEPSTEPCDNNGHGTHTMGTIVGDDGGGNQIGVAPGVTWIAAKGCEGRTCTRSALLGSGEWMLAPTDLNNENPRADLRPHIVNNSWGGPSGDPWYQDVVDAWIASGMFPAFSNGNSGPSCNTSGVPGEYISSYSVGSFDINNEIASTSSRGSSSFAGEVKPNIAAPGVNVRSSVPGDNYSAFSGTSMAAPHVAATIALMWSAAPSLMGDIDGTRSILDEIAIDTEDLTCGGTAEDNNVWGEGRLDSYAAVTQSPRGPVGELAGRVVDADSGKPLEGVTLAITGEFDRNTITDADGDYSISLPVGTYSMSVETFGYITLNVDDVVISEDETTTQNIELTAAPSYPMYGRVVDSRGSPVPQARVTVLGTPLDTVVTNRGGGYVIPSIPEGDYEVLVEAGLCYEAQTKDMIVDSREQVGFRMAARTDSFGYSCRVEQFNYTEAELPLDLTGDDVAVEVELPFDFEFYGESYSTVYVASNGFVNFLAAQRNFFNSSIPSASAPNAAIYPFWDDFVVDDEAAVYGEERGVAPNREFVIQWRNVRFFGNSTLRLDFELTLFEDGRVMTQYTNISDDAREQGSSATIGIENADGTIALQYSTAQAAIVNDMAIMFSPPR
ncbi:MAG: S8 family serine peptidase [Chloroflexota bacterium]